MGWSFAPSLGATSIRPFDCERRRNLGPYSIRLIQGIFSNVLSWTPTRFLIESIWNLYRLNIYGLEIVHLEYGLKLYTSLGGDVGPSVCLWEVSELRSPQHFTNPSVFFSMFYPELVLEFRSDQSETYTDWIYMGWRLCTSPWGRRRTVRFSVWGLGNLAPHSTQHFNDFKWYFFCHELVWTKSQRHVKITWRSCKGHVKATLRLWHDWVGDNTRFDHWAITQESCLITRKPLLIEVLSFLDLYYIDLSWLAIVFMWAIIQESCLITRKPLLIEYYPS